MSDHKKDTKEETENLEINENVTPAITEEEAAQLKPIQKQFMESYIKNKDKMPVDEWLSMEMKKSLPEHPAAEVEQMSRAIIETLRRCEENKDSLERAVKQGRSKESWFASRFREASSQMSAQEAGKYLESLDQGVRDANAALWDTLTTKSGQINQNPNLDGFIAERYHVESFNLNAKATGSQYRARVVTPDGTTYAKNSVDIEIVDGKGSVVRKYQAKYYKDADATGKAFDNGDYKGQWRLVPEDQNSDIQKKTADRLEAPDGTKSNPLTKDNAKQLQKDAQSGNWHEMDWNEYQLRDLAKGIGVRAGQSALLGAAIGAGTNLIKKLWREEPIDGAEVIEDALKTGSDFGIKAAAAGALKVGSEKGLIHMIPKGTPIDTITNIVHVGVENAKVLLKVARGDLSVKEGCEEMQRVTVSTLVGIGASLKGAAVGVSAGTVFGPVGQFVGGLIGGTVGYMAGSGVGDALVKAEQTARKKIIEGIKTATKKVENALSTAKSRVMEFFSLA